MEKISQVTRPIFWNISHTWIMYLIMILSLALFSYGIYNHINILKKGKFDKEPLSDFGKRLLILLKELILQNRTRRSFFPGILHSFIYYSFLVLFISTAIIAIDYDLRIPLFRGYLYIFLTVATDLAGIFILLGIAMALWRRYIIKPQFLHTDFKDTWPLVFLAIVIITGFFVEALRIASLSDTWAKLSPFGYSLSFIFSGLSQKNTILLYKGLWWFHAIIAFSWIALIPYSKFIHILFIPSNLFFEKLRPKGELRRLNFSISSNKDDSDQDSLYLGIQNVGDFTWKQRMDFYSCIACGRCEEICVARLSGYSFSPKDFILKCRNLLISPQLMDKKKFLSKIGLQRNINGEVQYHGVMEAFDDKYLWYCRTCMACMEICPATINHVDTLIEMRRFLVQGESHFPKELTGVFKGWKNMSNPWNLAANIRSEWSSGLNIMPPSNIEDFEFLYFVGCAGSFDDRNKLVSRAFVQIMKRAGVKFIYLGNDEKCCGETARRLGNEFLAQSMIEFNIRKWNQLGIKKIVTACPHCYNTIKNEYGQFGGHYEVLHHTELLEKILKEKRLTPSSCFFPEIPIVYHDPCYLCRANGIYETPRKVLKSALDINITEPKNHGPLSICCGGGGGSMWIEERDKKRASIIRFEQLMKTGAKTIVTACPYCLIMLDDEIKIRNLNDKIKVYDIVQILSRFIGD